jgi:hypothetical protein
VKSQIRPRQEDFVLQTIDRAHEQLAHALERAATLDHPEACGYLKAAVESAIWHLEYVSRNACCHDDDEDARGVELTSLPFTDDLEAA